MPDHTRDSRAEHGKEKRKALQNLNGQGPCAQEFVSEVEIWDHEQPLRYDRFAYVAIHLDRPSATL